MNDIIFIRDLKVEAQIGVNEWEQQIKQVVRFDVEIATDIKPAAKSKNIDETINYEQVANCIKNFVKDNKFLLIETLAEEVSELLIQVFNIKTIRLRLVKPSAVVDAKEVGIAISRP